MVNLKNALVLATAFIGWTHSAAIQTGDVIPDSYIVTFKPSIEPAAAKIHIKWANDIHARSLGKRDHTKGVEKTFDSQSGFQGYSGSFTKSTIAKIKNSKYVEVVEPNRRWKINWVNDGGEGENVEENDLEKRDMVNQNPATWGLGTISHRSNTSSNYLYDSAAGAYSYAYVVDTGIRTSHTEFEGRATVGWTAFRGNYGDSYGHGTHVSGTIAGKTYGVAKNAQLIGVKIFDSGSTTTAIALAGYTWAVSDIIFRGRSRRAVINMSISGPNSPAFNRAINLAYACNVITVVAAGNSGSDASGYSPSSAEKAITVGAIDSNWQIASFSNWGTSLNIFAPGVGVQSAWNSDDSATRILDGTSMATPHIAGLVLYAMSVNGVRQWDIVSQMQKTATTNNVLGALNSSPNLIGNNGNSQQTPAPVDSSQMKLPSKLPKLGPKMKLPMMGSPDDE
ncbi:hypothetical protein NM208_g5505 [Fusarium decemcellulare]|uniref:Uncharacterized protein n=1 Tax=Fusarium decemcellulare TaxID=57161 RepID=A0ACC1SGR0_9HYPO|nr:hypothetical protein NM208_g5505 [Fusarium decemcellulare]